MKFLCRAILSLNLFLFATYKFSESSHHSLQKGYCGAVLDFFASSKSMYLLAKCMKYIGVACDTLIPAPDWKSMGGMASDEYQALGKEAQSALKIPLSQHVPILKISPVAEPYYSTNAFATPNAICINESFLNKVPYGVKRCVLFHEAVHRKYNDHDMHSVVELFACIGAMITFYKLSSMVSKSYLLKGGSAVVGGMGAVRMVDRDYYKYFERRADIEGFYASRCCICLQDFVLARNFEGVDKGYLNKKELQHIIDDLKQKNKVCAYHSKLQKLQKM